VFDNRQLRTIFVTNKKEKVAVEWIKLNNEDNQYSSYKKISGDKSRQC
jgi:hypothetical protein